MFYCERSSKSRISIIDGENLTFLGFQLNFNINIFQQPFIYVWELVKIISHHVVWLFLSVLIESSRADGSMSYSSSEYDSYSYADPTERYDSPNKLKDQEFDRRILINRTRPEKCDKIITLFQLRRPNENDGFKPYDKDMSSDCTRPFIVYPIQGTNMILVAASTLCGDTGKIINKPNEIIYNQTLPCYKARELEAPYRRGLKECFNTHTNESQIDICGKANKFFISFYMLSIAMTLVIFRNICLSI